jgi:hypothetical protein
LAARGKVSPCSYPVSLRAHAEQIQDFNGTSQAQSPTHGSPSMIDGTKHPELIPDSVAYRLFLLTVAEPLDAAHEQKARQRAYLKMAGVADRELDRAFTILAAFKTKHDELVSEYNNTVDAANASGEAPDLQTFMSRQQKLVESTRNALKKSLSPTSMAKLVAHVQYEKRNMKVAREDR